MEDCYITRERLDRMLKEICDFVWEEYDSGACTDLHVSIDLSVDEVPKINLMSKRNGASRPVYKPKKVKKHE